MNASRYQDKHKIIRWLIITLGLGLAALMLVLAFQRLGNQPEISSEVCAKYEFVTNGGRFTPIGKKRCTLSLEKADTQAARVLGLSGRDSLPANRGMLFVFDQIGRQCIWMKDMKFAIDIAWLNVRGDVIKLEENVKPETYPEQFCADNTFFVIEVNAGFAKTFGLSSGSSVEL